MVLTIYLAPNTDDDDDDDDDAGRGTPVAGSLSTKDKVKYPLTSDLWLTSMFVSLKRSRNVPGSMSINLFLTSSFDMKP